MPSFCTAILQLRNVRSLECPPSYWPSVRVWVKRIVRRNLRAIAATATALMPAETLTPKEPPKSLDCRRMRSLGMRRADAIVSSASCGWAKPPSR